MRLLYVTSSLPFGPGEAFLLPEIRELLRRGHDVRVVPTNPRGGIVHEAARELLPRTWQAPLISATTTWGSVRMLGRDGRAAKVALRTVLASDRARTRIRNAAAMPKALWLADRARGWRPDHIHAHWLSVPATLAMVTAELARVGWSVTAHRFDIVENNLLATKLRDATFARFISRSGVGLLAPELRQAPSIVMIPVGVEVPAEAPPVRRDAKVLLCAARLLPVKGHGVLLDAFAQLQARPDVELWLAGDGPLRASLVARVERAELRKRVRFMGDVPHQDLLRLYQEGRVLATVIPSLDLGGGLHEGIPVALMEAMGFGVPVISTRTGGISELLAHGAGVMVEPGDVSALAAALDGLLSDHAAARALGRAGRIRVESHYAINRVVDALEERFATAAARPGATCAS